MEERRGEQFDRVLFRGALAVYACLVVLHRVFKDGCEFFLSDHFPLLGFVDVHKVHLAQHETRAGRNRRMALARLRLPRPLPSVIFILENPLLALKSLERELDFKQNHWPGRTFRSLALRIFDDFVVFSASGHIGAQK